MSVLGIYNKYNSWIDNQQRILEYQIANVETPEQLEQNQEYQELVNSTPNTFNLNETSVDCFFDSVENSLGMNKNEQTVFDNLADTINQLCGLETQENYENNVAQLGQGELAEKDTDADGSLSMDEYINAELADLGENATEEEKATVIYQTQMLFEFIDQETAVSNNDGKLSAEELAQYYKDVDRFENGVLVKDGTQDGMFTVDDVSNFTAKVIGMQLYNNVVKNEYTYDLENADDELSSLAQAELFAKDTNMDNKLSVEEYVAYSVSTLGKNATPQQKAQLAMEMHVLFAGLNGGDNYMQIEDIVKSYSYADKGTIDGEADGVIEANGLQNFASWFAPNSGCTQEQLDELYDGYLEIYS